MRSFLLTKFQTIIRILKKNTAISQNRRSCYLKARFPHKILFNNYKKSNKMFHTCSTLMPLIQEKTIIYPIYLSESQNKFVPLLFDGFFKEAITNTTHNIMKQTSFNFSSRGYESPAVNVLDVMSEGVLCASGLGIQDWETDDETLEF